MAETKSKNKETNGSGRSSSREDAFNMLAWMAEGAAGIASELKHSDLGLGDEFWDHAQAAKRESLLAVRSMLDQMIERSERATKKEAEAEQRQQRRGSVKVA